MLGNKKIDQMDSFTYQDSINCNDGEYGEDAKIQ